MLPDPVGVGSSGAVLGMLASWIVWILFRWYWACLLTSVILFIFVTFTFLICLIIISIIDHLLPFRSRIYSLAHSCRTSFSRLTSFLSVLFLGRRSQSIAGESGIARCPSLFFLWSSHLPHQQLLLLTGIWWNFFLIYCFVLSNRLPYSSVALDV